LPLQRNVSAEQTRHRVLDITVPPDLVGKYTLRAVYTEEGIKLDLNNLSSMMRSTMAEGKLIFND